MTRQELERFLAKRGFEVTNISEADYGFLVELKGRTAEAMDLFAGLQDSTPVIFKTQVTWWRKLNAAVQKPFRNN